MKLASIEIIKEILDHPNADLLSLAKVLGYTCIVPKGKYKPFDKVLLIQPDTVLPDHPWAAIYKKRSSRVKAIKLRGVWSMGIVEDFKTTGLDLLEEIYGSEFQVGEEVSEDLNITKYDPPLPKDLSAKGLLPFGIPKTDEERWQNIDPLPLGEVVDVTLKIDGQSWTAYCALKDGVWHKGICGRTLEFKLDGNNNYLNNNKKYSILDKLEAYCVKNGVSLALRGEQYGKGIQVFSANPHAKEDLSLALFQVYCIDSHEAARTNSPYYFINVAEQLGIPTVPILERNVILTQELVDKYGDELSEVNGNPFEGVVINGNNFSFKVINKLYDSQK